MRCAKVGGVCDTRTQPRPLPKSKGGMNSPWTSLLSSFYQVERALDFARAPIASRKIHTSTSLGDRRRRPSEAAERSLSVSEGRSLSVVEWAVPERICRAVLERGSNGRSLSAVEGPSTSLGHRWLRNKFTPRLRSVTASAGRAKSRPALKLKSSGGRAKSRPACDRF
jgi:hypothetical protein